MPACPVAECDIEDLTDDADLEDHLYREHDEEELAAVIVRLVRQEKLL